MNDDFIRVTPTQAEVDEFRSKHNGSAPRVYRVRCKACKQRLWGSGLGIGSHRRACKGEVPGWYHVHVKLGDGRKHRYAVVGVSPADVTEYVERQVTLVDYPGEEYSIRRVQFVRA